MFVHAREADSPSNMRYMGLLVDKYVPDLARCRSAGWAGAQQDCSVKGLLCCPACMPACLPAPWLAVLPRHIGCAAYLGVVEEQQALRTQLLEFVIAPLLDAALPAPEVSAL